MNVAISFFCSIFSITASIIYLFLREGFQKDYFSVGKVLGLSFLIIVLPVFLKEAFSNKPLPKWFFNHSSIVFVLLVFLSLLGYSSKSLEFHFLSFISFVGFPLFIWITIQTLKSQGILKFAAQLVFGILFSAFIVALIFSYHIKPLFFEDTFSWSYLWKVDTLFHMAVAQIFNTYGVFSPGLNGVAYLPYHYGSHSLYVGLANFLSISIPDSYILIPVVITAPVFFFVFFHLINEIKKVHKIPENVHYLFGIIFLMAFVGFFRNTFFQSSGTLPEYAGMLLGSPILFLSDSYTISVILLFVMLTVILNYYEDVKEQKGNLAGRLFLWIFLPSLFLCAGFSKISTLCIAFSILCFLFLRLKLYKKGDYIISIGIMTTLFVVVYLLVRDEKYGDGGFSLFYHFKEAKQNIFIFLLLHFSWVWALLLLFFFGRLGSNNLLQIDERRMPVEIVVAILAASLVPAFFVKVRGGQLYYFTEIASWGAAAIILAYLPLFKFEKFKQLDEAPLLKKGLLIIILFYLLNVFYKNFGVYKNQMLRLNYATRYNMLTGPKELVIPEKFVPKLLFSFESETVNALKEPRLSFFFDSARIIPPQKFITQLRALDNLSILEKRHSVVYVNLERLGFDLPVKCYERPFLIPALTGMASIHSGITDACSKENPWFSGYGYEYYDKIDSEGSNLPDLKSAASKMGFTVIYYYDSQRKGFVKVHC